MIEKSLPKEIESFALRTELGNYVDRDEIPSIAAETDTWKLWVNLRPFGLNEWLSQAAPRNAVSKANSSEHVKTFAASDPIILEQ